MYKNTLKICVLLLACALPITLAQAKDLLATYELAMQRDPLLRQAEATRSAVLETKPQSVARLLPTVTIAGTLNQNYLLTSNTPITVQKGTANFWDSTASINLKQPIYHHEYWVQLSQADNQIAQVEAAYAAAQQSTGIRVAQAYFNLLYAQDNLEFSQAEKQSIAHQLEEAKARFEVGLNTITDMNQAQAGFDQAKANTIKAENDVDNAREALREIIGEYVDSLAGLAREFPLKSPQPADLAEWDRRAQESNLNIIAAINNSEQAKKGIELQFAGHLPSLDLVGSASVIDNNRPNGVRTEAEAIGVQVIVPVFQGGSVNSHVRQARHEFEAAQDSLDAQRRLVTKLVKNAYRGVLSSISQVESLMTAVASAQSALEATEAGFATGTRTMAEVLTEQRNLFQAKRDYAKARYDYIVNSLTLKQAASELQREDIEFVNRWLSSN